MAETNTRERSPSHRLPEPIVEAVAGGACLRLILSRKRKSSDEPVDKVSLRPIVIGETAGYQLAFKRGSGEVHENLPPSAALERVGELFGRVFTDCHCFTRAADWTARIRKGGRLKVVRGKPSQTAPETAHDRGKQYLVPEGVPVPFLVEIGVMTPKGRVKPSRYAKFRQVNRFLELVDDVLDALPEGPLHVVDYGCGKSYLTFAVHHLLRDLRKREVTITGLDVKADVIAECNRIANKLGCEGLRFEVGHIADHQPTQRVDLAVSLHACDTATDDALGAAVSWNASAILAAPCCQHELLPQLHADDLAPLERHGALWDRFSSLATDALRATALEILGYRAQIVEFVPPEHTAKNLLIRATRRDAESAARDQRIAEYRRLREFVQLTDFRLEERLGPEFRSLIAGRAADATGGE